METTQYLDGILSYYNPIIEPPIELPLFLKKIKVFTQWISNINTEICITDIKLLEYFDIYYTINFSILYNIESIIKIQKCFRKYITKKNIINNKFKFIIEMLNKEPEKMRICLREIITIIKKYPPRKNENKFIYGKLAEESLNNTFNELGFECIDLDKGHSSGSEYKNDIKLLGIDISIKTKLNKGGDIILINKKSTENHIIKIEVLLCIIKERKLYFIPSNIVDNDEFVKTDIGSISYKSKLIQFINNNYKEYIYTFPYLLDEIELELSSIQEVDIMKKLYNETIKIN